MSALSKDARALLDAARRASAPTDADRARLQHALSASLGPLPAPAPQPSVVAPIAAPMSLVTKVVLATAIVGAGLGLGVVALRGGEPPARPALAVPVAAPRLPVPAPPVAPEPQPAPALVAPPLEPPRPQRPQPVARPIRPLTYAPIDLTEPEAKPAVEPAAIVPTPPDLGQELALLREAQVAARSGDAPRALALLEEHARKFPKGALREERTAAHIAALCDLRRVDDAREEAERFLAESPRSPYAGRVRDSCAGGR